ncbi:MAG: hypothetical protein WCO93_13300 [bacterium]
MATIGNITVHYVVNNLEKTIIYPGQNLAAVRPIDLILQFGGTSRAGKGRIWKMRKANRPGQVFDLALDQWDTFSSPVNNITTDADVWAELF